MVQTTHKLAEEIKDFVINLVIGSGYDYDSLNVQQKTEVSNSILQIYVEFIDKAFAELANSSLLQSWNQFKVSQFDENFINANNQLQLKIQEFTKLFFELQKN